MARKDAVNPSNYSRDPSSSSHIHVRYRGACPDCGRSVQATAQSHPNAKDGGLWARCSDCGQITHCDAAPTSEDYGGGQ